jgi:Uma2 family endonuclease
MHPNANVRAPDIAVTCVPKSSNEKFFPDPVLIVEVLSPSNERETWESIWACVTIPAIQEVMVVDSERILVSVYTKDSAGAWPEEPQIVEAGGTIRLASIDAEIAILDIYADTNLV